MAVCVLGNTGCVLQGEQGWSHHVCPGSRMPCVHRGGRAGTGAVAARPWAHTLAYLMETHSPVQALRTDLLFFPSLNTCSPHPQRLAEQRSKCSLNQGHWLFDVMYCSLINFPRYKVVLSRSSWQASQKSGWGTRSWFSLRDFKGA